MTSADANASAASRIYPALGWLVTLLTPVVLVLTSVRLLMMPAFLTFEYNTPNFPADYYGFTKEDRLYWSNIALEYLLNNAGIEFLGDLSFDDGSPVYNGRELGHMVDVKIALGTALQVWRLSLGALVLLAIWAWLGGWIEAYRRGLGRGGWLTAIAIAGIIVFVLLSFGVFFVAFHNVFFEPGTWMFEFSDTLIRLFPERFWRDIFIYVGVLSGGAGLLMGFLLNRKPRPSGKSS
jgi:integral membrane protein (TIGR01906 family)